MNSNNILLVNGGEYSVSEIFATDHRKIIIPDFQRDYCWGDKIYGEKKDTSIVAGFIQTLKDEYKNGTIVLGKIDVYQNPENHIYLTDGQQRITTIFLTLGMLCRNVKGDVQERIKSCLISSFELKDDNEPYLQYSIRESSIFFLRDLVNEFFLNKADLKVSEIPKQPWFFNEYKLDPTITSMLGALDIIERSLVNINLDVFVLFILDQLKFQYFDVKDRKHGEERFVIINTTGKGLSVTENLKPILLGKLDDELYSNQWEERETFFWKYREKKEEWIADYGVEQFMLWCYQIIEKQDEVDLTKKSREYLGKGKNKIVLEEIHKLYNSLHKLIILLSSEPIQKQFKFINEGKEVNSLLGLRALTKDRYQNILLPLLCYINKFKDYPDDVNQFLRRLRKNYFDLKIEERKINYVDWRYILQIIEKSYSLEDVLQYSTGSGKDLQIIPNIILNEWFNPEERIKQGLKIVHQLDLEEWEDHFDFMGDLSFLLKIDDNSLESADFNRLNKYWRIYKRLSKCLTEKELKEGDSDCYILSNYYRLFRLLTGIQHIGHINYCAWDIEGCFFSTHNRNHLYNEKFSEIIKSPDDELLQNLKNEIFKIIDKEKVFHIHKDNFTARKLLKAWMTLKVLNAEKRKNYINFHDGSGIAAYTLADKNKININLEFSLSNAICGYAIKNPANRIDYANDIQFWSNPDIIDAPFAEVDINQFKNREKSEVSIEANQLIVEELIKEFKISVDNMEKVLVI